MCWSPWRKPWASPAILELHSMQLSYWQHLAVPQLEVQVQQPCQTVMLAVSADWWAEGPEEVAGWVQVGLVVAVVAAEVELAAVLTLAVTLW